MEFIHITDNHLGRLKNIFPDKPWLDWSFKPLRQAEKYALDNGIEHAVHGGDFYDYFPTQDMEAAASDFFSKTKIKWHMLGGNHGVRAKNDHALVKLSSEIKEGWLPNLRIYEEPKKVKLGGINFIFLPWPMVSSPLLNTKRSVVFAHEERAGARLDNGRLIKGKAFDLHGHYWFLGHLHGMQEFKDVYFTGAPATLKFGESQENYFIHVKLDKKVKPKIKKVLVHNPYKLIDVRVNTVDDWEKIRKLKEDEYVRVIRDVSVEVPEWVRESPQFIKEEPFGDKKDLQAIKDSSINIEHVGVNIKSRLSLMRESLKQSSLTKDQKKRAMQLFRKELEEIRFQETGLR